MDKNGRDLRQEEKDFLRRLLTSEFYPRLPMPYTSFKCGTLNILKLVGIYNNAYGEDGLQLSIYVVV